VPAVHRVDLRDSTDVLTVGNFGSPAISLTEILLRSTSFMLGCNLDDSCKLDMDGI